MALPARRLLDAVAFIGAAPDLEGMGRRTIAELSRLIPGDQWFCCIVEVGSAPKKENVTLFGDCMPETTRRAYVDRYYFEDPARESMNPSTTVFQIDWRQRMFSGDGFAVDFMQSLMHEDFSAGIPILDPLGRGGMMFGLARTLTSSLRTGDEEILLALRPHLANYYAIFRRLESPPWESTYPAELCQDTRLLSRREVQVAGLLCRRMRSAEIATVLLISRRTVESHIEHIYFKLNVRNRRELLTKLLATRV